MPTSSRRRFDLGSADQPIIQFIAATLPFFLLLLWFLYSAHARPNINCYVDPAYVNDDATMNAYTDECSRLVPLKQYVYVYLGVAFIWALLAIYLTFYVPRRHRLVGAYLTQGEVVIGDVYYNRQKRGIVALTSYGNAVYRHPDDATTLLKRRVRVFERYTRERAAIVYLPGLPLSGQPKVDLQIDRDVTEMNRPRMEILFWFSWAWVLFSLLAPLYIINVMKQIDTDDPSPWQPDVDLENFPMWYCIFAYAIIPVVATLWNVVAWYLHKRWMTVQHRVLQDGEPAAEPGCCFDDEEREGIESSDYEPPTSQTMPHVHGKRKSILL